MRIHTAKIVSICLGVEYFPKGKVLYLLFPYYMVVFCWENYSKEAIIIEGR